MLLNMLSDWPFGTLFGLAIVVCCAGLIGGCLWAIYAAVDLWGRPRFEQRGVITNREFVPAHTTSMVVYNPATRMTLPEPVPHPDDWRVTVAVGNHSETVSMSQEFFDSVAVGTKVIAKVVRGRFSTNMYIRTLRVDDGTPTRATWQ